MNNVFLSSSSAIQIWLLSSEGVHKVGPATKSTNWSIRKSRKQFLGHSLFKSVTIFHMLFYQYDIGQPLWIGYFLNEPATRSLSTSSSVAVLKLEIIQRAHDFIHKIRKKIISTQQLMRSRTKRTHEAISRTLHNY